MVQTAYGHWAEKVGVQGKTRLHETGNPSTFEWTNLSGDNRYDGDKIVYLAISR